jgi:hypothetical protein
VLDGVGARSLLMSIQLPRNLKELHFTGSVKALAPVRPANALGQERPKAANGGPLLAPPPKPLRSGDVYVVDTHPTPYFGGRPSERAEAAKPIKLTTARGQLASMDEDLLTDAIDRDQIDAALFPVARRANASQPAPNLPVPHFRSAVEAKAHHAEPVIVKPPKAAGLPLVVWLVAALAAGIVSYQIAPQAAASVSQIVRSYEHAE